MHMNVGSMWQGIPGQARDEGEEEPAMRGKKPAMKGKEIAGQARDEGEGGPR